MSQGSINPDPYATFLGMLSGSVGSTFFRKMIGKDENGRLVDHTKNGDLSCAYFVSSVLHILSSIYTITYMSGIHLSIDYVLGDILEYRSGWQEIHLSRLDISKVNPGAVIVWGSEFGNRHIGFKGFGDCVISNSSASGRIERHDLRLSDGRTVCKAFWHKSFGSPQDEISEEILDLIDP